MTGLDRWQELREAAAIAKGGPWDVRRFDESQVVVLQDLRLIATATDFPTAAFIAAASPDVVLSLLGVVDRQARQLAAVEKLCAALAGGEN